MMKPKHLLMISIGAGLLAVVLVRVQISRERGDSLTVFRAVEGVAAGQALGDLIEPVTLPGDNYFPNLLKEAPTAEMRELVANTPLRQPISAGEIVLYRHLEQTVDPGIRSRIPAGLKAISIEVDEATSVGYLVEPGDRVDVLAALPGEAPWIAAGLGAAAPPLDGGPDPLVRRNGSPSYLELETRPLLEGVEVLAVGDRYLREELPSLRGRREYSTVSLLVTPEQAQRLAHARDVLASPMTLVLRGGDDDPPRPAIDTGGS